MANTFSAAYRVAVDTAGNVYVLDSGTGNACLETLSGGNYARSTVAAGLSVPNDGSGAGAITVDSAGNVYIAETGNKRVWKDTPSNGAYTQSVVLDSTTYQANGITVTPQGIAVDTTGAVIITNENYGVFKAAPNGAGYTTSRLAFGNNSTIIAGVGASIDPHGNLYIIDFGTIYANSANELAESASAESFGTLNVGTTAPNQTATFIFDVGGTLATTPYAVSTQGDLTLDFQPAATQPANVCVAGRTYNPGDTCTVTATFTPARPGARYGAIVLFATSGTPIATSYLRGVGTSPQVSFSPRSASLSLGSTFFGEVTTDSSNDVIIGFEAVKYSVFPYTSTALSTSFNTGFVGTNGYSGFNQGGQFGDGMVVDGAGNLVYADGFSAVAANPPYTNGTAGATSFSSYLLNPNLPVQTLNGQLNADRYGKAFLASIPMTNPVPPVQQSTCRRRSG